MAIVSMARKHVKDDSFWHSFASFIIYILKKKLNDKKQIVLFYINVEKAKMYDSTLTEFLFVKLLCF